MPFANTSFPQDASAYNVGQAAEVRTGRVFYVDSGLTNASNGNDGKSPRTALATINGNFDHADLTANNGDTIYLLPGHTETHTAAAAVIADIAGVRVVGIGDGRDRPTFNFNATAADWDLTGANCSFENIVFDLTTIDAVVSAFDVGAADITFRNCEFIMADACGQAVNAFTPDGSSSRLKIIDCIFRSTTAGANSAILIAGTPDGIEIAHNHIYGDFAEACIDNAACNVATNVNIHHNYLQNDNNGDHAIQMTSAVTGVVHHNLFVTDAIATAADLGATMNWDNQYADDGAADATASPYPGTITTGGNSLSQIADRLGSDADTDAIAAMLGGTAGIATMPAAAVPANAVNVFELLREIWAVLNGTAASENGLQS